MDVLSTGGVNCCVERQTSQLELLQELLPSWVRMSRLRGKSQSVSQSVSQLVEADLEEVDER